MIFCGSGTGGSSRTSASGAARPDATQAATSRPKSVLTASSAARVAAPPSMIPRASGGTSAAAARSAAGPSPARWAWARATSITQSPSTIPARRSPR